MHSVKSSTSKLRVVVLGYIVRWPLGGMAWHHLQYVMGLADLGHDVYFLEESGTSRYCCYDPVRHTSDTDCTYGVDFAGRCFERVGLSDRWAYYDAHKSQWHGPCGERTQQLCSKADLVLNLSGVNPVREWLQPVPARALIDQDPVFTQIEHLTNPAARDLALQHNTFFSFGENIGLTQSGIPNDGFKWKPTRQPIVLDAWPITEPPKDGKFTTVLQWDSYPTREYAGRHYGMKSQSFLPFLDLPGRTKSVFELAVGGVAKREVLTSKGWALRNPIEVTSDLSAYQRYIQESEAEFSVAKHGYVVSRSGWFSDRSAAYLASGRPVLLQDTGFSDWMPAGSGVLAFSTPDEALAGVDEINRNYRSHCRAAREIAEEYFDAGKVLSQLIESAMNVS